MEYCFKKCVQGSFLNKLSHVHTNQCRLFLFIKEKHPFRYIFHAKWKCEPPRNPCSDVTEHAVCGTEIVDWRFHTDLLHLGEFFDILTFFNQIMLEYLSHLQQKFVIWRRSMILKRFHRKSGLICDNLFSRHVLELGLTCSSAPWTWHIFITDVFIQIIFLDVNVYCERWLQHSRLNQKEICLICEVILMYSGQWWQRADINVTSISQFYVL